MTKLNKYYTAEQFVRDYDLIGSRARILNAGSSTTRFGENCVNVDIQDKPNVDLVADLHCLPEHIGKFDAVVCNAVLQYCHSPAVVMQQFARVLQPGGLLFVEAPWVQPYCDDTADLYRFSEQALLKLMDGFDVITSGPSITPGSAFVMQGSSIAGTVSGNKYLKFGLSKAIETLLYPLHWVSTSAPERTAGANFVVATNGQKDGQKSTQKNAHESAQESAQTSAMTSASEA